MSLTSLLKVECVLAEYIY